MKGNHMQMFTVDSLDTYLPEDWDESRPGALAIKIGIEGGIIDLNFVYGWFIIFGNDDITSVQGLKSRSEAFKVFQEKILEYKNRHQNKEIQNV
jgi:hypothetical protein